MNSSQFWAHLDKLILSGFVVYFSVFGYLAIHFQGSLPGNPFVDAMLDNEKLVIGALLGLITGRAVQRAQDATNPPEGKS